MPAEIGIFRDIALVFAGILVGGALAVSLRQPLFVGYVIGGLLVSPFTPGPAVRELATFELFAQVGVVLLMFSIGIEFSLRELTRLGPPATLGAPLTMAVFVALAVGVGQTLGWPMTQAVAVGIVLSVSSTMVAVKLLVERGEAQTPHGRLTAATTLAEDLVTLALIVLLPLLAGVGEIPLTSAGQALLRALVVLVPSFYLAIRLVPRLLERIARRNNTELFLLVAVAIAIGTAGVSNALGLSVALGAFLAGLIISESEFTHEILAQLLPLRDVFVALFFVSIGMLIRPQELLADVRLVLVILGLILVGKFGLRIAVLRTFGYPWAMAALVSAHLAQTGEFTFVLAQVGRVTGVLSGALYNAILAGTLVSVVVTALFSRLAHRLIEEAPPAGPALPAAPSVIADHVLICGFGRVGGVIGGALRAVGVTYAVVDLDFKVIQHLQRQGIPSAYGDAASEPVLRHLGAAQARMAVVAIPDLPKARLAVRRLKAINPRIPILVRSHEPQERDVLQADGATEVIQPEFEAAVTLTRHVLELLGVSWEEHRRRLFPHLEASPIRDDRQGT